MLSSHKIALAPNNKQATYFAKASGVARFAYNWALSEWQRQYQAGSKPTETALRRQLNSIKHEQFPWMLEVTKNAPQMAIIHLGKAFKNFFAGRAKYPRFKKKGIHDGFQLTNDQFTIQDKKIHIPRLGWVKMHEALRLHGKIVSATISRVAGRWFASVTVETEDRPIVSENQATVGLDVGIKALATLSTGEVIEGPKPHRSLLNRLRRLSRSLSKKEKGSKNRYKAKQKLAKLHARISSIRQDALHKLTTSVTSRFSCIVIEDLNVKGMMANRHLSRAIGDMGFFELRRQLEYKAKRCGSEIIVANRWFASTKTCSKCDFINSALSLAEREWTCPSCKITHDRDLNAAINLEQLAASSAVTACGEEGSDVIITYRVKPSSMKQESNTESAFE